MRDFDYAAAADFIIEFFGGTTSEAVEVRALPNERGDGANRPLFTRDGGLIQRHCEKWDDIGRAVYFGVATRKAGLARGDRGHVCELSALWADIDTYKLGIGKEEAAQVCMSQIMIPPSLLIDSGGGLHAYWLLKEAIDVSQNDPALWPKTELEVVGALKQIAGVVAGDNVADLARVMRLPGTHHTKGGEPALCRVLPCSTWVRYEFGDIVDMLAIQRPVIARPLTNGHAVAVIEDNPYLAAARMLTFKPSIDVAARLSAMTYLGDGEAGIHATQLSVSASLVSQGADDDAIVTLIMEATQRAAGVLAANWNWTREEASVRAMVGSAKPKFSPAARRNTGVVRLHSQTQEQPEQDDGESADRDDTPKVLIGGGKLAANIDEAEHHLIAAGPPIYQYGDLLVRVAPGPIVVALSHQPAEVLGYRTIEMTQPAMRDNLSRHVDFMKFDARAKKWRSINCPADIAEGLIHRVGAWRFPALRGIVSAPIIRPDLSLFASPGYDPVTRLYFAPGTTVFPSIPSQPTRNDALAALAVLQHPLREMPFADDASRSVAVSTILTGLDRPMMNVAPIHAFDAPQAGSGKGLICNYCAVIITGHEAGAVLASDDPVETDKTLAAKLIAGHSIVLLDNVTHALHSALLAQITSEPIVEPRILGHSRTVAIQNTVLVLINGNNLALLGDLPRRALKCRLDAKVDRPELRVFHSENPLPYAKRNRPELVAAALTILLAYRVAGSPDMGVPALGTFEQWSTRVRNALLWLDQADPIETQKDIREVDRSLNSHMILLEQWFEAAVTVSNPNATSGMTAKRLIEIANEQSFDDVATRRYPELFDALYDIAGARDRVDATKLGNYLNRKVDQMVGRMRLERAGKEHSAMLWRVVRMP